MADLRCKAPVSTKLTDKEVFESLELGDCWWDAELPRTFFYLWDKTFEKIPNSWLSTMKAFHHELQQVLWLINPGNCPARCPRLKMLLKSSG